MSLSSKPVTVSPKLISSRKSVVSTSSAMVGAGAVVSEEGTLWV